MKLMAARNPCSPYRRVAAVLTTAFAQSSAPLVQKENLVYQGAFRVPQGTDENNTFNYGGLRWPTTRPTIRFS